MRMKIRDLPEEFITMYNLINKATSDEFVYILIQKGMYGLASHRWVFLHKNSWSHVEINMAIVIPSFQASGNTTIDPYLSHFVWMILALSMLAANMLNTLPPFSANTTRVHTIGTDNGTSA